MKNTVNIRVVIADDHELFRDGLRLMLSKEPGIELLGDAANGKELLALAEREKPDVILTDIVMPEMDGIEATRRISALYPQIGILALSMFNDEWLLVDILQAGAIGYLQKNSEKAEIIDAIHSANMLTPYYCKSTSFHLATLIAKNKFRHPQPQVEFTEKEKEIITCICEEFTNREIGEKMFLSKRTVDGYRSKILDKMHVKSTAGIVIYAIRNSLYKVEKPLLQQP